MEITHEYAQAIVDRTMEILGMNINIMNSMGIIVGSGDKSRLNTYHQGAEKVIKSGKPLEISSEEMKGLEGSKPGVNYPIYLNDKIVGVVGITGEPKEVRPFGQLLKMSVETMLTQSFLAEELNMERNAKEFFVDDIISGKYENMDRLLARGKVLGYDMNLNRVTVILRLYDIKKENQYFYLQRRREQVLMAIRNCFSDPQNLISYKGSDDIVILYRVKSNQYIDIKKQISQEVEILNKEMKNLDFAYCIGIGGLYSGICSLRKSYKEAVKAIKINEAHRESRENHMVFSWELSLEMLIRNLPKDVVETYKKQVMTKISSKDFLKDKELTLTLQNFFDNNLNISCAAKDLGISRNTMNNRLKKIEYLTGLNPKSFNAAVKLKILMLMR